VEAVVDLAIERALRRLNVPTRNDLDRLTRRVNELSRRLDGVTPGARRSSTRARTRK
jgi:polyhydroxyalkanoate synthesis regulator phasin